MTLRELRERYPWAFHPNQDWFDGEAFMERDAVPVPAPCDVTTTTDALAGPRPLMSTATLCAAYVTTPTAPVWRRYLWTADVDHLGQRVYVGDNGKGLEIHRHLHLTERWGVPLWD